MTWRRIELWHIAATPERRLCTPHPDVVGGFLGQPDQHGIAGQTKDKGHSICQSPSHPFGTGVMAVATNGDPGH